MGKGARGELALGPVERDEVGEGDALPEGWMWTTLGEAFPKPRSKVPPDPNSKLPFVGMDHILPDTFQLIGKDEFCKMKSAGSAFSKGDVLYGRMRSYLNKVHSAKFEGVASAEFIVFPKAETHDSEFLKYLLHQTRFVQFASKKSSGDRPRIKYSAAAQFEFGFPPLAEQKRIVSRIEELFSRVEVGERAIVAARAGLKRYRKAVLKAAVTGEMTADWRADNPPTETAADLRTRILKERRAAWEKAEHAKLKAKNKPLPQTEAQLKKFWARYKEPVEAKTDDLPEIPEDWVWVTVDELINRIDAGKNFKCDERPPNRKETGIVKVSSVTWDVFNEDESKTITDLDRIDNRYLIRAGDLLISRANTVELVGASALVRRLSRRLLLSDKVLRLVPVCDNREWMNRVFKSHLGRLQIEALATGAQVSMRNISQDNLRKIAIPLPPLNEQAEIVSRVEAALSRADAAEATLDAQARASRALKQAILKAAFTGKLVPQDPNDEPASDLLKRVKKESCN